MRRMRTYYYGCKDRPGHYLFQPSEQGMRSVGREADALGFGWAAMQLDGNYPPAERGRPDDRGHRRVLREAPQGAAALHHVERRGVTWTIVAFWDRSVDDRPGCSSTFLIEGQSTFEEAMEIAKSAFPSVWARLPFEVVPAWSDRLNGGKQ